MAAADASALCSPRWLSELFDADEQSKITAVAKADGTATSDEELRADAKQWTAHFALNVFNNHCANHGHDCTKTCMKYAKKKLESKQNLRSQSAKLPFLVLPYQMHKSQADAPLRQAPRAHAVHRGHRRPQPRVSLPSSPNAAVPEYQ